ncbi:serine protein kinase RIO [Candidatus Woesearchaeota archaeon]|nr:serine protein kinase RIO [Candidatus Woesearchaeota archaeon]
MVVNRSREAWKTYGNVFDAFTLRNLERLASQGYFEELKGSVALGKEANVFVATNKEGEQIAIKIYRLENCNFNKMYEYISQDPRYLNLKGDKRRIIFAWTQREYRNLLKARELIRVPTPMTFKDNIVVTEFIDDEGEAAPQLKDSHLENPQETFDEIVEMMKQLFKTGLIHGDLSEFNILMQHGKPVFIDFSQATAKEAPNAKELLKRDIENICRFFRKQGVKLSQEEVYSKIIDKEEN